MKINYKPICTTAYLLASIGARNWGSIAAFKFNLVEYLFASYPSVETAVYALVGVSGALLLWNASCSSFCKNEDEKHCM